MKPGSSHSCPLLEVTPAPNSNPACPKPSQPLVILETRTIPQTSHATQELSSETTGRDCEETRERTTKCAVGSGLRSPHDCCAFFTQTYRGRIRPPGQILWGFLAPAQKDRQWIHLSSPGRAEAWPPGPQDTCARPGQEDAGGQTRERRGRGYRSWQPFPSDTNSWPKPGVRRPGSPR